MKKEILMAVFSVLVILVMIALTFYASYFIVGRLALLIFNVAIMVESVAAVEIAKAFRTMINKLKKRIILDGRIERR